MKIAYLSSAVIPSRTANSIHIMKMCKSLANDNNDVTLLSTSLEQSENNIKDIHSYYGVEKNFSIKKFKLRNLKGGAYLYGLNIARWVKKSKIDLIYGRFLPGCYFSSLLSNSPVIFESHEPIQKSAKILNFLFRRLLKRKNFVMLVVISQKLKQYYVENYNIEPEKILVAHDGADISPRDIEKAKLAQENEKINIGYVGHLYSGKGMEIIAQIAPQCPWANFHIVGGLKKDIDYWSNELVNLNNVIFYGFVPHSQTASYIAAFDILLAPYLRNVSGHGSGKSNLSKWMSPLKIFEYMSLGKPIVASNLPVLVEVLRDKENSMLCDPDNSGHWIQVLERLSEHKEVRDNLGLNAKKDFEEYFTWQRRVKHILCNSKCLINEN